MTYIFQKNIKYGGVMMYNPIKKIKQDYFSLEFTLEIIFNISAIFFISLIYYVIAEVDLIQSDFLLFIILIISIFMYYLFARIFFSFPSPLKDKSAIFRKEEPFMQFEEPARIIITDSVINRTVFRGIGDERALEPLIQALKDEKWNVRVEAASALGKIGDERAVEPLIQVLQNEGEYEDARKAAKESIEMIRKCL